MNATLRSSDSNRNRSAEGSAPRASNAPERAALVASAQVEVEVFELVCQHMRKLAGAAAPEYDDLVQSAAEGALRDLDKFEGRSSLSTWVFRICYSTMLDYRRWHKRWFRRLVFGITPDADAYAVASDQQPVDEALEWHERNRRLQAAISRLSPKRGVVVALHDLQGLSIAHIAEELGIDPLTVRSRLRDGRKDLARRLRNDPYLGSDACRSKA